MVLRDHTNVVLPRFDSQRLVVEAELKWAEQSCVYDSATRHDFQVEISALRAASNRSERWLAAKSGIFGTFTHLARCLHVVLEFGPPYSTYARLYPLIVNMSLCMHCRHLQNTCFSPRTSMLDSPYLWACAVTRWTYTDRRWSPRSTIGMVLLLYTWYIETMCSRLSSYKGWDKAELSRGSNPRDVGWCWWGSGRKWKGDDQSNERDIEDDEETIFRWQGQIKRWWAQ